MRRIVVGLLFLLTSFAVQAEPPSITLPDLNPSEWFDGKMGGTFGAKTVTAFAKTNRVIITGFRVVFVTHNEARAIVRASYLPGRDTGTAKAKMEVDLKGVDDATLQAITDHGYRTLVAQLRAAGREVIELEPSALATYKSVPKVPQEVSSGLLKGKAFAPTGWPLWWQVGEAWGDAGLAMKNLRAFADHSFQNGSAIAIAPLIVVDFAQMQSSGNRSGLVARRAEVGATLAMSVPTFYTRVARADQVRGFGVSKGDDGDLRLMKVIDTDVEFAEMFKVNEKTGEVLSWNGADHRSRKMKNVAETTNEAYTAAAHAVIAQATGTFARLFAEHQPAAK